MGARSAAPWSSALRAGRRPTRPRMTTGCCTRRHARPFLQSRGLGSTGHDRRHRSTRMRRADDWYLGDGWYSDGPGHTARTTTAPGRFSSSLSSSPGRTGDAERLKVLTGRLRSMCESLLGLIDGDGSPVYWGRSLTYRSAPVSRAVGRTRRRRPGPAERGRNIGVGLGRRRPTIPELWPDRDEQANPATRLDHRG